MHILLIHQAFSLLEEPGGTRHYELARYLVQNGHRVTIVASDLAYATGKRHTQRKRLVTDQYVHDIHIRRAYTFPSLHRSFAWRVISFLSYMLSSMIASLRIGSVDLVIGTSPQIFQCVSAWLMSRIYRCPFLLEIRDLWPEFAIDIGILTNPILIKLSRYLEHFLYARADHIVVNSPAYRDYLQNKGILETDITLVANGVDTGMFNLDIDGSQTRIMLSLKDKFIVTYAGALGLANNVDNIIYTAHRLLGNKIIHFLIVGDGKERENLENLAKSLKLTNLTFTGVVPKNRMPEILAASDACIATLQDIPMFRTTYPNKVFDYMAAGRPTILAIDGVIRDVIETAKGGVFVPPGDSASLAEAICMLYQDPDKAKAMGNSARSYVEKHFNRQHQAAEFSTLIQQVAKK